MKKTLALVLALAMVFSTITVAFAEDTLGADAQICADLGMLKGETGTVDAAYVATAPTRLQAAVMFLRLKGLEAEALAFTGEENFADGNIAWAEGANLLAYLKANPQLGWVGDGVNFNPSAPITAKEYYKVLLETLGYKQTTAEVVGDFTWENVVEFAATVGLSKVADVANFTVNDLAVATVEALKVNVKDTEKTLLATLVEAGKITEEAAVATGLMEGAAQGGTLTAEVDDVYAVGNAVVQVEFVDAVDEAAATNLANYSIEGLAVNAVTYVPAARANGDDRVIIETAAQEAGKLYKMTVGDKTVQFAGLAKQSDGPQIEDEDGVVSEDVEEVVVDFDRNIDYATGTDVANYSISGVTIVKAEVDRDEVTLTTEGLKDGQKYTLKCTNIKSVDLVNRKTTSDDFKVDYDTAAPKVLTTKPDTTITAPYADTNTRVKVYFDEEVDEATAEDIANYSIKVDETNGAALEILSIEWDGDDENNVEITTEPMDKHEDYKITISGIADQCKVPNVMTKAVSRTFEGVAEDKDEPDKVGTGDVTVIGPTKFIVKFKDKSRLDSASVLDMSNYDFEVDGDTVDIESIEEHDSDTGYFEALFTVEGLTLNDKSELTYVDIMDEYGNATDEESVVFYPREADFASAHLDSAEIIGENEVLLTFSGNELDEDSAENIANYRIDEGLGIPTKAEFEADDQDPNTVLLTVNDMDNGEGGYDMWIDGLKDIAGNSLKINKFSLVVTDAQWDEEFELEDVEAANHYVVAASFDEVVDVDFDNAEIWLTTDGLEDDYTGVAGDYLKLDAKSLQDDDTIVEFSDYGHVTFDPTVTYTVYQITGVTDQIGNALDLGDEAITFDGSDDEPEYAEFESYEQIDARTVALTMSRDVKVVEDEVPAGYDIAVDDDDLADSVVYFRKTTPFEDDDYDFVLYQLLTDEHGIPATDDDNVDYDDNDIPNDGLTTFACDVMDDDAPSVDDVVAVDRYTVKVTFDQYLRQTVSKTDLKLVNTDDDDANVGIDSIEVEDTYEDNVLLVHLSKALDSRYEYELRFNDDTVVSNYYPKYAEEDTFTFDGTNLAQYGENP